jgi:hydroxyacylglutathione hydrolase
MKSAKDWELEIFVSPFLDCNLYLLDNGEEQVLIDPCVPFVEVFRDRKCNLQAIFFTHVHIDHVMELPSYLENTQAKLYFHRQGLDKFTDAYKNGGEYLHCPRGFTLPESRIVFVEEETVYSFGNRDFRVLETPGHTDCSICIISEDLLFTGDTLFEGTIGRIDLYSSSRLAMMRSLDKILELDSDYQILPGHGPKSVLSREKITNPFLKRRMKHV